MINIELIQYVKTPASQVYQALTTAAGLAAIWTEELVFSAKPGAINEFRFGDEPPPKCKSPSLFQISVWTGFVWIRIQNG